MATILNHSFSTVYFDIVGYCNAKCPYCHSGRNKIHHSGKKISPDLFRDSLKRLLHNGTIHSNTTIHLYNWGEPFLHPQFQEIVQIINEFGLHYAISTNASVIPALSPLIFQNLDTIRFSMPGFSQESYDKIHGFQFTTIQNNIIHLVKKSKEFGFKGHFLIAFHIYNFNKTELKSAELFASKWGILFDPYYALLNHWELLQGYNTLPSPQISQIQNDICHINELPSILKNAPKNYTCPQWDYLVLDETGNIAVCCQLPKTHSNYSCGNILDEDLNKIMINKNKQAVCSHCIDQGMAYYFNSGLGIPDIYRRSISQYYLLIKFLITKFKRFGLQEVIRMIKKKYDQNH